MKRDDWKFSYKADVLLDAATKKLAHHQGRLSWWTHKKEEVVTKVRAEGIEVDESLADTVSNSYNRGATVQIRNDLVQDLQECVSKMREHRNKAENYEAWTEVLASQGSASFDLNQDDWLFFFSQK